MIRSASRGKPCPRREGILPSLRASARCPRCRPEESAPVTTQGRQNAFPPTERASRRGGGRDALPPGARLGNPTSSASPASRALGGKAFCLPCVRQHADLAADLKKARLSARREGRMPSLQRNAPSGAVEDESRCTPSSALAGVGSGPVATPPRSRPYSADLGVAKVSEELSMTTYTIDTAAAIKRMAEAPDPRTSRGNCGDVRREQ